MTSAIWPRFTRIDRMTSSPSAGTMSSASLFAIPFIPITHLAGGGP